MNKREEADSGLRAGFIHEDEMKQYHLNTPPSEEQTDAVDKEGKKSEEMTEDKVKDIKETKESKEEAQTGPKVAVQGVSGKMITGIIKAVKKKKPAEKTKDVVSNDSETATTKETVAETAPAKTTVKEDKPLVKEDESLVKADKPLVKEDKPLVKEDKPLVKEDKPLVKADKPIVKEDKSLVKADKPIVKEDKPLVKADKPLVKEDKPLVKVDKPLVKEDKPLVKVDRPIVKEDKPLVKVDRPIVKEDKPLVKVDRPIVKEDKPLAKVDRPIVKEDKPLVKVDRPIVKEDKPLVKEDRPLVKEDGPRIKSDQGVILSAKERLAKAGKTPIRPQSGNYVGRNRQKPQVNETRGDKPQRGGSRGPQSKGPGQGQGQGKGQRPFSNKRGPGRQEGFVNKDKDEDEKPRFSRSPKPKKKVDGAPEESLLNRQKEVSRRNFKTKNQRDQERRSSGWRSREEIEFDEEAVRRARRRKARTENQQTPVITELKEVTLPATMTVKELAEIMKKTSAEVITKLMAFGVMATLNQEVDFETAAIIANEFGIKATQRIEVTEEDILFDDSEDVEDNLVKRPPVVVVMGHVDHGKTSILDWIRSARVAAGEAGGITQHIGAYMVDVAGKPITFLDTPGHEAFTTIRARGAQVTDIAVLVVAADDSVMPQTIEALNHARAADTEIIVAINKIDKPGANIDRVKQDLAAHNVMDSEWGGTTTIVPVSAKTGENMQDLLEMIILTAEVMELKANPTRQAKGTVIEASLDKNRGPLATLLIQRGTLKQGDAVVVGTMLGTVRAMFDDHGQPLEEAGPSVPVEIMGLPEVPEAGDIFYEVENEKVAKSLVERRQEEEREQELNRTKKLSLENLFEQLGDGETKDLNIIVKADVQGSVQAMSASLEKLSGDEVRVHIIHGAVGSVTASDIRLAEVSDAIIIGFNVRPPSSILDMAEDSNVEIRLYRVIYEALEDIEKAMKGMLDPIYEEEVLGSAEVREIYKVSGVGTIAGCYVTEGLIRRRANARVVRDGIVIHEGKFASLKRFQDDAREVQSGYECGLSIERFNDIKEDDVIECYHMKEIEREL